MAYTNRNMYAKVGGIWLVMNKNFGKKEKKKNKR